MYALRCVLPAVSQQQAGAGRTPGALAAVLTAQWCPRTPPPSAAPAPSAPSPRIATALAPSALTWCTRRPEPPAGADQAASLTASAPGSAPTVPPTCPSVTAPTAPGELGQRLWSSARLAVSQVGISLQHLASWGREPVLLRPLQQLLSHTALCIAACCNAQHSLSAFPALLTLPLSSAAAAAVAGTQPSPAPTATPQLHTSWTPTPPPCLSQQQMQLPG
jgi:hypothetical protein